MPLFLGLARQAGSEIERRVTALATLGTVRLTQRVRARLREQVETEVRAAMAEHRAREQSRSERLESALTAQDAGLAEVREQIRSLVSQLNERLLPGIDERMDETERDLTRLATGLVQTNKTGSARESRLQAAEQRLGDLRARLAHLEQRAGLWRDLQASMARLGDDVDGLRARLGAGLVEPPLKAASANGPVNGSAGGSANGAVKGTAAERPAEHH